MFNESFKVRHCIGGAFLMATIMYGFIWGMSIISIILQ